MDMQMPAMDGLEAGRLIRHRSSRVLDRSVPILAITANVQQTDQDRCFEAGMNGFLAKPISLDAVSDALEHWLPGRTIVLQNSPLRPCRQPRL
jgi:CheY-like chemotaxis protein